MMVAMILAHLIGDYVLQTDRLAAWKARAVRGVLVHGSIVTLVTVLIALPFDLAWWPWALGIGLVHTLIDLAKLRLGNSFSALGLFILDQMAHLSTIVLALYLSGYLVVPSPGHIASMLHDQSLLTFIAGYVFITAPAWVIVEFVAHSCTRNGPPAFTYASNKYVSSLERSLIATLVLLGQYLLVPLVVLPRLAVEHQQVVRGDHSTIYTAQCLISTALAVAVGLGLRYL